MQSLFKQYEGVFAEVSEGQAKAKEGKSQEKLGFVLADAVGKRSAKEAWVELVRQIESGISAEQIHASIAGKVRDMLLSQKAEAEELGTHPFVYKKAKADFKNWTKKELEKFYDDLVLAYHRARMGEVDLSLALEKLLLAL